MSGTSAITGAVCLVLSAGWVVIACGDGETAAPVPFELTEVVSARLAKLEAEVGPVPSVPQLEVGREEEVEGMVSMLANSQGRMREVPLATIREDIGPAAVPSLVRILTGTQRSAEERVAAAELLGTLEHPAATEALMQAVEQSLEPWMRRWCAYHLPSTGDDRVVPRLIARLNYEKDPETFVWLAMALARYRNYSGLSALIDVRDRGATETIRATATSQMEIMAGDLGMPAEEAWRTWNSIEAQSLPQAEVSDALRLELWRLVLEMDEDHFQLRGVDDARFVLSRLGPWAAGEVSAALGDTDAHVRLHCAQVLERMGPRASSAGPALLRALGEPLLAPAAAEALGRVGYPPALDALLEKAGVGNDHELRVAAVRALGRLGVSGAVEVVVGCFGENGAPLDLRMAAATALVLLGEGKRVTGWLIEQLTAEGGDPDAAEIALETWMVRSGGGDEVLKEWRELASAPGLIPSVEEVEKRQEARWKFMTARFAGR